MPTVSVPPAPAGGRRPKQVQGAGAPADDGSAGGRRRQPRQRGEVQARRRRRRQATTPAGTRRRTRSQRRLGRPAGRRHWRGAGVDRCDLLGHWPGDAMVLARAMVLVPAESPPGPENSPSGCEVLSARPSTEDRREDGPRSCWGSRSMQEQCTTTAATTRWPAHRDPGGAAGARRPAAADGDDDDDAEPPVSEESARRPPPGAGSGRRVASVQAQRDRHGQLRSAASYNEISTTLPADGVPPRS